MKKVVILLPTYNEKENIAKFVERVAAEEKNSPGWKYEFLIVDSHSPDGTFQIAQELAKKDKNIHAIEVGRGLGVALVEGHRYSIEHLKPDALAQLDADGQVLPDVLPRLLKALDEGYDLALGSRFVQGGKNSLPFMRRVFSAGASMVYRILVGPYSIKEVTNSARAFTPELFQKINFKRLPWKEQTFIVQPAFLNEAILAGANYKEVALVFTNRAEGYSKNKVFNYTYDVFAYSIDAFFRRLGFDLPIYKASKRAKTFVKFGLVGVTGTLVDFIFYKLFIAYFGMPPATAKGFSTEVAIVNNFVLNNFWTFKYRKTNTSLWQKFLIFNTVSLGALAIGVVVIKWLHSVYGDGNATVLGMGFEYNTLFFLATIPPVLIWNFTINNFFTWKHKED